MICSKVYNLMEKVSLPNHSTSKWPKKKLGDLCEVTRGSSPRPITDPVFFENGTIPWVKIADATKSGKYLYETKEYVNEYGASFSRFLPAGTILVAASGTLGYTQILGVSACAHDGWLIIQNLNELDRDYAYYVLHTMQQHFFNNAYGAAIQNINTAVLRETEIPYPPFPIQKRIGEVLSAYDALIENNNRRIALLEESMRLLYREWFVRLRFPGHEHVRVVGGLPEGWERTKLREVASYINRGISPKYGDSENRWVINQKCVREGRLNTYLARQHITEHGIDKGVKFGDVLVNSTGIGTLGRVAQVYEDLENYTVDSHITIVRPNKRVEIDYFGLFILGLQSYFDQMGAGSTGQTELSRDSVANADFILPTIELQKEFGNYISSQRQMIQNLLTQNKKLSEARDLLLPRLMSGEIDVS